MGMNPPPPGPPEGQYAQYYRPGQSSYGSSDRLQGLVDGYFGLNNVFLINVGLVIGLNVLIQSLFRSMPPDRDAITVLLVWVGAIVVIGISIGFLTYPSNKKIAYGKDWPPSNATLASVLMGLNSALCCGVIGYVVMQQLAMAEMKKYGVKAGFGFR